MNDPEPITDPIAYVRQALDDYTASGDYVPAIAAGKVFGHLAEHQPGILAEALWLAGPDTLRQWINTRDHSRRGHSAHRARSGVFRAAADAAEAGDSSGLHAFLDAPYTVADGQRRTLGKMRSSDLQFVAAAYEARAASNAMIGAFMRALDRQVGDGLVEDHYTEDQLAGMWDSLAA